jgi:hypothetical protein
MRVVSKIVEALDHGDIIRHPVGDRLYHSIAWVEHRETGVYVSTDTCAFLLPKDTHAWVLQKEETRQVVELREYRFDLQDLTT